MNTLKDKVIPVNADVWTIKFIQTEYNVSEQSAAKLYKYVLSEPCIRCVICYEVSLLVASGLAYHIIERDD